jgi:hypothetical protein
MRNASAAPIADPPITNKATSNMPAVPYQSWRTAQNCAVEIPLISAKLRAISVRATLKIEPRMWPHKVVLAEFCRHIEVG